MEIRRVIVGEGVVCMMMILMEGITIGLTIMASTIMSRGMSPFVFVVYTNALSSFFLLPYSFSFYTQIRENPLVSTFSLLMRFFFLGLTGVTIAQNLAFVGLSYSSPIMACGMANLIPSFTFLLSIISRKTKIEWRGSSFIAKLGGTLISIMGAISLAFYKGPVIKYSPSHDILRLSQQRLFIFTSPHENWILGAILMAAASFSVSIWNIIQVQTLKKYQEVMTIVSFYSLFGTIQTAAFSLLIERNSSAWKLKLNMDLPVIVATAIFSSVVRSRVQIWCMRKKGPFYVPMFKPAGIPIATICGCLFFASTFHYGSIMGAFIVGVGTYLVMWGNLIEDEVQKTTSASDLQEQKTPLLEADGQV